MNGWTEGKLMLALAGGEFRSRLLFPQADFAGGRLDLLALSRSGYATEYEFKISRGDWNADREKSKWRHPDRRYIARFFYVVPDDLADRIPEWVPAEHGVIAVSDGWGVVARVKRDARRLKAERVPDAEVSRLYRNLYYRFWDQQVRLLREARDRMQPKQSRAAA